MEAKIRKQLNEPLPDAALKRHPSKSFLTVIDPMYVIERLNTVFGIGKWKAEVKEHWKDGKDAVVLVELTAPEHNIQIQQFGGNNNSDIGDAYKGAMTDALTKCASYLEIGIEIYKGLKDEPRNGQKEEDSRPWLSEEQMKAMLGHIEQGGAAEVQERMGNYRMKKLYRETLNNALQQPA